MINITKWLGVDAGNICIIDTGRFPLADDAAEYMGQIVSLEAGEYTVRLDIPNTYLGNVKKKSKKFVCTGEVWIGDGCYLHNESLMEKTNYFSRSVKGAMCARTGGDGEFLVQAIFIKNEGTNK